MDSNQMSSLTDIGAFVIAQFLAFGAWIIRLGGKVHDNTVRIAELEAGRKMHEANVNRVESLLSRIDERTAIMLQRVGGGTRGD